MEMETAKINKKIKLTKLKCVDFQCDFDYHPFCVELKNGLWISNTGFNFSISVLNIKLWLRFGFWIAISILYNSDVGVRFD